MTTEYIRLSDLTDDLKNFLVSTLPEKNYRYQQSPLRGIIITKSSPFYIYGSTGSVSGTPTHIETYARLSYATHPPIPIGGATPLEFVLDWKYRTAIIQQQKIISLSYKNFRPDHLLEYQLFVPFKYVNDLKKQMRQYHRQQSKTQGASTDPNIGVESQVRQLQSNAGRKGGQHSSSSLAMSGDS